MLLLAHPNEKIEVKIHSRNRPYCVILSRHYRGFTMTLEGV